jgi:hypothetical protein
MSEKKRNNEEVIITEELNSKKIKYESDIIIEESSNDQQPNTENEEEIITERMKSRCDTNIENTRQFEKAVEHINDPSKITEDNDEELNRIETTFNQYTDYISDPNGSILDMYKLEFSKSKKSLKDVIMTQLQVYNSSEKQKLDVNSGTFWQLNTQKGLNAASQVMEALVNKIVRNPKTNVKMNIPGARYSYQDSYLKGWTVNCDVKFPCIFSYPQTNSKYTTLAKEVREIIGDSHNGCYMFSDHGVLGRSYYNSDAERNDPHAEASPCLYCTRTIVKAYYEVGKMNNKRGWKHVINPHRNFIRRSIREAKKVHENDDDEYYDDNTNEYDHDIDGKDWNNEREYNYNAMIKVDFPNSGIVGYFRDHEKDQYYVIADDKFGKRLVEKDHLFFHQ